MNSTTSKADIHIIGSGIQFIPEDHRFEKWANFPKERQKLFDLFNKYKTKNVVLISGDRHIAEISKLKHSDSSKAVYEVTSSGLTHSYESVGDEPNRHRISKLIGQKNYGIIQIDWQAKSLKLLIKGEGAKTYAEEKISF
ncbi:MAG: alkaline phosphatase D family protein [Bacteroidota bacterium]